MLKALYKSAVRFQLNYSLPIQVYASQTYLACLDAVPIRAIRLICTKFRTAPISAYEFMVNVPPLTLRRERAILIYHERYKRLEESCPPQKSGQQLGE
nr:hypothetical protein BgiMline_020769 [Biomphalaria glabrata]